MKIYLQVIKSILEKCFGINSFLWIVNLCYLIDYNFSSKDIIKL